MTQERPPQSPRSLPHAGEYDGGLSAFFQARPRLFGIAYRMLGSAAEAEDIVQDVWLRWQTTNRSVVQNPPAFLATTATRLCVNAAQAARSRRETYAGPWLPEPVDTRSDPSLGAERGEMLSFAVLLLLEKLSPTERAAYILREAFDYEYSEIANILQMEEANGRQLVSRARKHIADERRAPVSFTEQRRLMEAFIDAARRGNMAALENLFAEEAASYSVGGGLLRAARAADSGRELVTQFIASLASNFWAGVTLNWAEVNGQPSILILRDGAAVALATMDASAKGINLILWIKRSSRLAAVSTSGQKVGEHYLTGPTVS